MRRMSTTRFLKTNFGVCRVDVKDDIETNIHTRNNLVTGKLIAVGGKHTCVFIKTSTYSNKANLHNVKTSACGCEVNHKKILGENTVRMVKLAFTIVKEVAPHVKMLELDDTSAFECKLEDGRSFGISIALYELAFHQATWYERHFDAKLITEEANQAYIQAKEGFHTPKPEQFDFLNNSLNQLLWPMYASTKTWKDFFAKIYNIEKKCRIMFPWYMRAVASAMGGMACGNQTRIIDIYSPTNESIPYTEVQKEIRGGTRKIKNVYMDYGEPIDYILESFHHIPNEDIRNIKFTKHDLCPDSL